MDFYVPCVSGNLDSYMSAWAGVGGNGNINLVQAGTSAHRLYVANYGWYTVYQAWVENLGDSNNPNENDIFSVNCGDHMQVEVSSPNCMYIERLNDGLNSGQQCYGPGASQDSAEAMTERPNVGGSLALLANFGTATFHSVFVVDNAQGYGMSQVPHDYSNMWSTDGTHKLATVGPIQSDTHWDMWSMYWQSAS